MPSVTDKQRRFFGAVYNCKTTGNCPSPKIKKTAKSMSAEKIKHFLRKENNSFISFADYIKLKEAAVNCSCECMPCKQGNCKACDCENCECEGCACKS